MFLVYRSRKSSAACCIDGTSGAGNIASLFSSKLISILNLQDASDRDSSLSFLEKSLSRLTPSSFQKNALSRFSPILNVVNVMVLH